MKVAIQGELGSFSHQAATKMLSKVSVVPLALLRLVFEGLHSARLACAVIPIENSLAGSVTEHYDLLLEYSCYIEREYRLRIVHNLIAAPGMKFGDLRLVFSHPVALAQCRNFFRQNPKLRSEPFYDTAGAVKRILENKITDAAGIASKLAAAQYGGKVLKAAIEDNKENYTRFFLVRKLESTAKRIPVARGATKASIAFALKNKPGTLFRALHAFAAHGINMTKIESRPVPGKPWEYIFYVDLLCGASEFHQNVQQELARASEFVKALGFYPAA
jgi:prephenate dehydratase